MTRILAIAKRELGALFGSPVAYIVLAIFTLLVSWLFTSGLFLEGTATFRSFLSIMPFVMLFVLPALAMRSFAEERKSGTLDLLLTLPIREWEIVIGKLLALTVFWAAALVLTLNLPFTLVRLGDPDGGALFAAYVALFFTGVAMLSISVAASVLTENQVVAFLAGIGVCFFLLIIGHQSVLMALGPTVGGILELLSLQTHFDSVAKGVLDVRDLFYFLAVAAASGGFVLTVLESRKWR